MSNKLFTRCPLNIIQEDIRFAWNVGERDIWYSEDGGYFNALSIAKIATPSYVNGLDNVCGDFISLDNNYLQNLISKKYPKPKNIVSLETLTVLSVEYWNK